jgi:hypothetical protein
VLILGSREIKKNGAEVVIEVPIENKKAAEAEKRVNSYVDLRKQEIREEEEELVVRNQQKQLEMQNLAVLEGKDVGGLTHSNQKDASRNNNPKSRSNISAI